jgi:hypothetical protein
VIQHLFRGFVVAAENVFIIRNKIGFRKGGSTMKMRSWTVVAMMLAVFLASASLGIGAGSSKDVPRVEKDTLKGWLGDPNVLLIDVRAAKDWQGSDKKIKGAVRQDPEKTKTWAAGVPKEKRIVLYCA